MTRSVLRPPPLLVAVLLLLPALGCGLRVKRPVLYPNYTLIQVGKERAEADIDACTELAYEFTEANPHLEAAQRGATDTAVASATGAAGGAIVGRAGTGAAMGAATAGTRAVVRGALTKRDPPPLVKTFVVRCLRERGYDTIGWR